MPHSLSMTNDPAGRAVSSEAHHRGGADGESGSMRRGVQGRDERGAARVLMICAADLTLPTATSAHFTGVARALQELGWRVELFTAGAPPELAGLKVTSVGAKDLSSTILGRVFAGAQQLAVFALNLRRLRRRRFDLIYVRTSSLTLPITLLARFLLRGLVMTEHNGWIADEGRALGLSGWIGWLQARFQRAEANASDVVRAVTPGLRRVLVERGVAWDKIAVIGNGTDTEALRPMEKAAACRKFDLPADRPIVGFIGNLVPWQGLERLIDILPDLLEAIPDLVVVVAGGGPCLVDIERRAETLGVSGAVRFPGWVPHAHAREMICSFDVAVAPFVEERNARIGLSPLKIRDYSACGRAIVTTRLPGLSELAAEDVLIACDTSRPSEFAAQIVSLLNDDKRREALGRRAREYAEVYFDWSAIAARIDEAAVREADRARPLVAHVMPSLQTGGAERMLANYLAHRADAAEHVVVALTGKGGFAPEIERGGVPVIELEMGRSPLSAVGTVGGLRRAIRGLDPDVVDCWMYHGAVLGFCGSMGMRRRRKRARRRLIVQIRCTLMALEKYGAALRASFHLTRLLIRFADNLVYNSSAGRTQHAAAGFEGAPARVIHNGVDTEMFRPNKVARARLREEWGIADEDVVICTVARYDPMKGYDLLLEAVDALAPTCHFVVAGLDTDRYIRPRSNLTGLGIRHDIPEVMAACDVYCLPSTFGEGFPNVLIEAMAVGLFPVAFDVGDCAEIIGELGFVVRPSTAQALQDALTTAVRMRRTDAWDSNSIRRSVIDRYDIRHAVEAYEQLYR